MEQFQAILAYSTPKTRLHIGKKLSEIAMFILTYLTHYFGINFKLTVNIHAFILFDDMLRIVFWSMLPKNMKMEQSHNSRLAPESIHYINYIM